MLDGRLDAIRREAAADRLVAIAFANDVDQARAVESVLADRQLVVSMGERKSHLEVELAASAKPEQLLATLVGADLAVRRFEVVEPSLHQIFVDRVGAEAAGDIEEEASG